MLVKRITRAVEECKLDITLACFLCKSTLRTSSVMGGGGGGGGAHPTTKLLSGAVLPPPPPSSAAPETSLKDYSTIKQLKTN